jgi:hypothetical protein
VKTISNLSRRQLGAVSAFGSAYVLIGGGRAQADQKNNSSGDLENVRAQTSSPRLIFTGSELQLEFGPNVFSSTPTVGTLFANGRPILKTQFDIDAPGSVPALSVGMKGIATHLAEDRYGNTIESTSEIESINDVAEDFLATGKVKSRRFTG